MPLGNSLTQSSPQHEGLKQIPLTQSLLCVWHVGTPSCHPTWLSLYRGYKLEQALFFSSAAKGSLFHIDHTRELAKYGVNWVLWNSAPWGNWNFLARGWSQFSGYMKMKTENIENWSLAIHPAHLVSDFFFQLLVWGYVSPQPAFLQSHEVLFWKPALPRMQPLQVLASLFWGSFRMWFTHSSLSDPSLLIHALVHAFSLFCTHMNTHMGGGERKRERGELQTFVFSLRDRSRAGSGLVSSTIQDGEAPCCVLGSWAVVLLIIRTLSIFPSFFLSPLPGQGF